MKVINLDKFKAVQMVSLDGKEYEVKGLTVDQYLKGEIEKLEEATSEKEKLENILAVLTGLTNVPRSVLVKQPFPVLNALIQICQGNDPSEDEKAEGDEPGKK
jgi:hypothetical protein